MNRYKCIIVDDEQMAADGNFLMLEQDPSMEVVAICYNGIDAIEKIDALQPDILLLDIEMPEISGFDVLRSVKFGPPPLFLLQRTISLPLRPLKYTPLIICLNPIQTNVSMLPCNAPKNSPTSWTNLQTTPCNSCLPKN